MKTSNLKLISYYLIVVLIITVSFFLFSTAFYPDVNSDMAINVLIADSFSLPHNIYWWNQDRLGSFIPLISQPFIKMGMSSLLAISICNYLVITLGFIGYSKLFKHKTTILLFALAWFFPYQRFIDLNVFPLGLSYGLFGFSLLFLRRINLKESFFKNRKNLLNILATTLIWFCAVWISDLMYITLLTLGIATGIYFFLHKDLTYKKTPVFLTYGIVMIAIILVILKLKTYATGVSQKFASINTLSEIKEGINMVIGGIIHLLDFRENYIVCLGAWSMLIFSFTAFLLLIKYIRTIFTFKNFWLTFFLADFTGILLVIFLSHWVYLNDLGYWYFVAPYISCVIFILLLFEHSKFITSKIAVFFLFIGVFFINLSPVFGVLSKFGEYRSIASKARELNQFGEIGIIGDFWESYKFSIVNPKGIKSTPHDKSDVKDPSRINEVITQSRLFISKNEWMESFPDTLNQFGFILVKKGNPIFVAGSDFCEYKLLLIDVKKNFELNISELTQNGGIINENGTVTFTNLDKRTSHSIYGPKFPMEKGKYRVEFYVSGLNIKQLKNELMADISYNSGQNVAIEQPLNQSNYNKQKDCFSFIFDINKRLLLNTEFRILERKSMNYTFHKIVVNKIE